MNASMCFGIYGHVDFLHHNVGVTTQVVVDNNLIKYDLNYIINGITHITTKCKQGDILHQ